MNNKKLSNFARFSAFGGASVLVVGALVLREINPAGNGYFPQCPFHALTGLNCPGCGATRGVHALLNGDVFGALHFNALLLFLVPLMSYAFLMLVSIAVRGRFLPIPKLSIHYTWIYAVALIVFGVARNLPFYPFSLLAI